MDEGSGATAVVGKAGHNRFLLLVAGLGGLLYGVDVNIITGALPYLSATSGFNVNQLSFIVAAVLLGSVISTLFAGILADLVGRKKMMVLSGLLFVISIPTIVAIFLSPVGRYGYSTTFFMFTGFTMIYFITATFFLPETKGKTLEEIEQHFEGGKKA
ncbi:MAG TPA: MFS transporter [Verrucomicrobiae bacterium]|nr:MFS transporter [Verrucomicrobiae bacterium]